MPAPKPYRPDPLRVKQSPCYGCHRLVPQGMALCDSCVRIGAGQGGKWGIPKPRPPISAKAIADAQAILKSVLEDFPE